MQNRDFVRPRSSLSQGHHSQDGVSHNINRNTMGNLPPDAEMQLRTLFGANAQNFLDEAERLFRKKIDKINARYNAGQTLLQQSESEIQAEMHLLSRELANVRGKKLELDRAKEQAIQEARLAKEQSAKEFLALQEAEVKKQIDKQLRNFGGS